MSKKKREAPASRAELLEASIVAERAWMHGRWSERMTFDQISALAARPLDAGGLGRTYSVGQCRRMVQAHREHVGEVTMTREERRDRQSDEIDERARRARFDLAQAHATANTPMPKSADFADRDEWVDEVLAWRKNVAEARALITDADRRLASAMKDERDLHGLTAAAEVKVDVVHRDAIMQELEQELAKLDEKVKS